MKCVKMLAAMAAALMAIAGSASANSTLTSPEGTTYTGEFSAKSMDFEWHGAFVVIKCGDVVIKGKVEAHTTANASGSLSSWTFSECNYTTTVKNTGALKVDTNGTVFSQGAEITMATSVGTCVFTTHGTDIGTMTEGKSASWDVNSAKIPRTGGNFLCGSSATWTGSFDFTTPNELWVD